MNSLDSLLLSIVIMRRACVVIACKPGVGFHVTVAHDGHTGEAEGQDFQRVLILAARKAKATDV